MDALAAAAELEVALGLGSRRCNAGGGGGTLDRRTGRQRNARPKLNLILTLTRWPSRRGRRSLCGCRWCSTTRMRRGTFRGGSTTRTPSDRPSEPGERDLPELTIARGCCFCRLGGVVPVWRRWAHLHLCKKTVGSQVRVVPWSSDKPAKTAVVIPKISWRRRRHGLLRRSSSSSAARPRCSCTCRTRQAACWPAVAARRLFRGTEACR